MARIEDREDYYSNANLIRQDNKRPPPPSADKNFRLMVQGKQKQTNTEKKEANEIEEETEVDFEQQKTRSVQLKSQQAKALNSLLLEKKQEESVEAEEATEQEAIEEQASEADLSKTTTHNQRIRKEAQKLDYKSSLLEKIDKAEDMVVELTPEEIKNLQELLQKDTKEKVSTKKELLNLLDAALATQEKVSKKAEKPLFLSPSQAENSAKQLSKTPEKDLTPPPSTKEEGAKSPLQNIKDPKQTASNQAAELKEPVKTTDENLTEKVLSNKEKEQVTDRSSMIKKEQESSQLSTKTQDQNALENAKNKQTIQLKDEAKDLLQKDDKTSTSKNEQQILQERSTNDNSRALPKNQTDKQVTKQADKETTNLKETTQKTEEQTLDNNHADLQSTNMKNLMTDNLNTNPMQIPVENKPMSALLNDRFLNKKEMIEEIRQATQPSSISQQKTFESVSALQDRTSSKRMNEKQESVDEKSNPTKKDSRAKSKNTENRTIEAETSSAASMAPVMRNLNGPTQLDPEQPEISQENTTQLIKELVEQIAVIKTQGQTDTIITLRSPKLFEGATIKISTYDQARGEINISFANLSPQAKKLLDSKLAKESLKDNLKSKSITVHNIITTTQAETPLIKIESEKQNQNTEEDFKQNPEEEQPQ